MPSPYKLALVVSASIAVVVQGACAQRTPNALPVTNAIQQLELPAAKTSPPSCKGQRTTKQYATAEVQPQSASEKACVPAFGGFGDKISSPSLNPPISITCTSSTTNYDNMPDLGSGTPILY